MLISSVTQKGQATIPLKIRLFLGLKPGSKVQFIEERGEIKVKRLPTLESFRGALKGKRLPTNSEMEKIFADESIRRYKKTFAK
jgi:AbrB family looped-hinge helix DNA binding protein